MDKNQTYFNKNISFLEIYILNFFNSICLLIFSTFDFKLDNSGPSITYVSKTNNSGVDGYAKSGSTITVTFKATDNYSLTDNLTKDNITVKVGGTTVTPTTKTLTSSGTNPKTYTLTLSGITENGALTIVVDGTKVSDEAGNTGTSTKITPGIIIDNVPIKVISGDGTNVGDEIAIGDEHFYVILNDGTNITMLAKYSLCEQTYTQQGYTKLWVPFNNSTIYNYAGDRYLYNDSMPISQYVNNYKTYLESLGASITEARLIRKDEINMLSCNTYGICNFSENRWARSGTYWTGAAWCYESSEGCNILVVNETAINDTYFSYEPATRRKGVRPVIVISADI